MTVVAINIYFSGLVNTVIMRVSDFHEIDTSRKTYE